MRIKRTQLVVEIPPDLRTQLKVTAAARGISLRDLLTPALQQIVAEASPPGVLKTQTMRGETG
ncbi:MAG: hypothetical protein P9E88_16910 [Candidatus Competibacter sp.]|jgi:predicted HicB family RNase H-like nuclease|nr:hypothetical protein [Candidatus Competibacteraceae bacterium]MDG4562968.1 hypothetical protein [Candidatus Competibacter sp.]